MMNLHLGKELEAFINAEVASNITYIDASEWVREAIREKINSDKHHQGALHNLRADIDTAWRQADEGKTVNFNVDEMMQELDAECPAIK